MASHPQPHNGALAADGTSNKAGLEHCSDADGQAERQQHQCPLCGLKLDPEERDDHIAAELAAVDCEADWEELQLRPQPR